jgi:hypothetical protein
MLQGIRIYTSDAVWQKVLQNLGAAVVCDANTADVDFDSLDFAAPASLLDLKSTVLAAADETRRRAMNAVFGKIATLPDLQTQIVVLLHQTGGMLACDLKTVLGIPPDVATHTIETAIYQLRKTYGRDFIKNNNGKYSVGKL